MVAVLSCKNQKNGTFTIAHFCVKLSSAWPLATYMSLADHKGTQEAFSAFVVKLYGFCLSITYIARRRHLYIEILSTL